MPINNDELKERVKGAVQRSPRPYSYWGNKLGWPKNALTQFIKTDYLGHERLVALEALLIEEGALTPERETTPSVRIGEKALQKLATRLRELADVAADSAKGEPGLRVLFVAQELESLLRKLAPVR